jgi:hypothetical protein
MSPEDFDDLVSLYLDDALPPERAEEFNRLLATRPDLAARFVRLSRVHGGLREVESMAEARPASPARPSIASRLPLAVAAALLLSLVVYLSLPEAIQGPTVGRPGDPEVLLVAGKADELLPGDRALRDRLVRLGFRVTPVKDSSADLSKAEGCSLIVISESTVSSEVGGRLAEAPIPLLNCEPNLGASLRLTTRSARPDEVFLRGKQRSIRIVDPAHPLAGGLQGSVAVYFGRDGFVAWGVPDEAVALVVARCDTREAEPALFAYEPGKAARGADLPARRVAFFVAANTQEADRLTPDAWTLFDSAVRWLTGRK